MDKEASAFHKVAQYVIGNKIWEIIKKFACTPV